ncbi:MAG: hypothetical protein CK424_00385 [Legionella sp.]|nr:MAG: hypothetical protein CK424_00385 [Legionella sp.]
MKGSMNLTKVTIGIAALTLSSGIWAQAQTVVNTVTTPVVGVFTGATNFVKQGPFWVFNKHSASNRMVGTRVVSGQNYVVTNRHMNNVVLDGVNNGYGGYVVSNPRYGQAVGYNLQGDRITNMTTNRTGIITGIKDQGTMDVMKPNGKMIRYQYVTYKVKPL